MNRDVIKERTKLFALRIIKLVNSLPYNNLAARAIANQLVRSGTLIGANYRSACRSRSKLEFISKIGVVIEEADETVFWLELIIESKLIKQELLMDLFNEANEITAIMVATSKSAKNNLN